MTEPSVVFKPGSVGGQSFATPVWECSRCGAKSGQGPEFVRHHSWCEDNPKTGPYGKSEKDKAIELVTEDLWGGR